MKYMGSKARYAKDILPIILANRTPGQWYVEPFVGGANVIDKVGGNRIGNDSNFYLISLLNALSSGWTPPTVLDEALYNGIKNNMHEFDPAIVGFAGVPCSYAAKWFGGYCRGYKSDGTPRDYIGEAYRNCIKQAPHLAGIHFTCGDYKQVPIPKDSVIYCDPPYGGATKYTDGFDTSDFWEWCDGRVDEGHQVFVSEYTAPPHWVCVWQKQVNSSLTKNTGAKKAIEKLFTRSTP